MSGHIFGHLVFNATIVALAVVIHYEALFRLSKWLPRLPIRKRARIVFGVFGAMVAHVVEIWLFGIAYYLIHHNGWGELRGNYDGSLLDSLYFSFTTYTTLGFGDIEPLGDVRFLVGIESLTGLVLITWTASFLFYEMQRYWGRD